MKVISLISVLFLITSLTAQKNDFKQPDYKTIEKNIKKKKSNYYYPHLFQRFLNADTSLNLSEKRHLYYGYSFNINYSPYGFNIYKDSVFSVFENDTLLAEDFLKIALFCDSALIVNPFDLKMIKYQLYAFRNLNDTIAFNKLLFKRNMIVDAILSSGNGLTKKDAFYVIYISNEYSIINLLGFEFGGMQSLIEHYDYLTISENEYGVEGFYFDVSPSLNSMSKMFKN